MAIAVFGECLFIDLDMIVGLGWAMGSSLGKVGMERQVRHRLVDLYIFGQDLLLPLCRSRLLVVFLALCWAA